MYGILKTDSETREVSVFDSLSQKLTNVFERLRGRGRLTEADLDKVLREIRLALLDADVAIPAVKALLEHVKQQAIGQELIKSVTPAQMIVKIVYDAIVEFLGAESSLNTKANAPFSYLFVGLQGAGKTTSVAKVARTLEEKHHLLLVSLDVYRPAAQEQLQILAESLGVRFFTSSGSTPLEIVDAALTQARKGGTDIILWDTAGRLQIDETMMQEIAQVHTRTNPVETLLVADAMMGQEALNVAKSFQARVPLTGLILTRADGDMRGGAALSMRFATGCPVKFLGTGEAIDKLIPFDPRRIADQILDQGDIVKFVETAAHVAQEEDFEKLQKRLMKGTFNFNDYLRQIDQMQRMGGLTGILSMLPGAKRIHAALQEAGANQNDIEKGIKRQKALIQSMTPKERRNPQLLNGPRRRRIALGAGQTVTELNRLIKRFEAIRDMTRKLSKGGGAGLLKMLMKGGGSFGDSGKFSRF